MSLWLRVSWDQKWVRTDFCETCTGPSVETDCRDSLCLHKATTDQPTNPCLSSVISLTSLICVWRKADDIRKTRKKRKRKPEELEYDQEKQAAVTQHFHFFNVCPLSSQDVWHAVWRWQLTGRKGCEGNNEVRVTTWQSTNWHRKNVYIYICIYKKMNSLILVPNSHFKMNSHNILCKH